MIIRCQWYPMGAYIIPRNWQRWLSVKQREIQAGDDYLSAKVAARFLGAEELKMERCKRGGEKQNEEKTMK